MSDFSFSFNSTTTTIRESVQPPQDGTHRPISPRPRSCARRSLAEVRATPLAHTCRTRSPCSLLCRCPTVHPQESHSSQGQEGPSRRYPMSPISHITNAVISSLCSGWYSMNCHRHAFLQSCDPIMPAMYMYRALRSCETIPTLPC